MKMIRPKTNKTPIGDSRSRDGEQRHKLYTGRRWRKLRALVLQDEPLCRHCKSDGKLTPATVVDHIAGHGRGWEEKFFDINGLQALCHDCHTEKTAKESGGGYQKSICRPLSTAPQPSRDKKPA